MRCLSMALLFMLGCTHAVGSAPSSKTVAEAKRVLILDKKMAESDLDTLAEAYAIHIQTKARQLVATGHVDRLEG